MTELAAFTAALITPRAISVKLAVLIISEVSVAAAQLNLYSPVFVKCQAQSVASAFFLFSVKCFRPNRRNHTIKR